MDPYRMASAMIEAGIPEEAIGLYPGDTDVGAAILADCGRSMIFGSAKTVEQYRETLLFRCMVRDSQKSYWG